MRKDRDVRRQLEALFRTDLATLYRLVRRNMARGREPLALHRGGQAGYYLSCLTDERVKRETFLGTVDERTTADDLKEMTEGDG
jgi:DNA polymerase III gamma/tau subunit